MDGAFRGQASTAEHVKGFPAEGSSQVSKAVFGTEQYQGATKRNEDVAECGEQRSNSSWDEAHRESRPNNSSTKEDVYGIATLESLQGNEILMTMSVWRSDQSSQAC